MLDQEARLDAIRNGRTYLSPGVEAIGYVFGGGRSILKVR